MLQADSAATLYQLINGARLGEGLAPFGSSTLLTQAAQRHAEDIAGLGKATHEGSDGSDDRQRIRATGYRAWNDGLLVNEALWIGLGSAEDALNWFRNTPDSWPVFVDSRYREIGVGYAEDDQGAHYFVITFGTRPGVLPIFLNDGAEVTDSPQVAVRLTNEDAEPNGEGSWMGRAIEVRLNNTLDFEGIPWQPWEALLPWLLDGTEPGEYAVYVEFRDGANRTAVAEDTIRLVAPGEAPPAPTPRRGEIGPTPTPLPASPQPTAIATDVSPAAPSEPQPTAQAPTDETVTALPPATAEPFPTWTPLPPDMPAPTKSKPIDWPLIVAFGLQGLALILGMAVFLRRK